MAIINIHGKQTILPDYNYSEKYWPILSELVYQKVKDNEIKEQSQVDSILKECFTKLCSIFSTKINEQTKASFFIFCHHLHEESIDLYQMQLANISLDIDEHDFSRTRRVLKIILEQCTRLELTGTINFKTEAESCLKEYCTTLEELLYIGTWCITLSEYIARNQLFSNSIGLKVDKTELNILTYQPYTALYEFVNEDIPKHSSDVVIMDSITEFKTILQDNLNVNYDALSAFLNEQLQHPEYRFGTVMIDDFINLVVEKLSYPASFVKDFYLGLTVSRNNVLSIENCILNNQNGNRYIYRPILEIRIDGQIYNLIGYNKWLESFMTLTTNSLPFGMYPIEWQKYLEIKKFVNALENRHDNVLIEPITELLKKSSFPFDTNVKSFQETKGKSINIERTIGDIDILFIDNRYDIIYVCECKHNRSRFDMNNWKRDYSNFKVKYESQLERKVEWVTFNKELIESHFRIKMGTLFPTSIHEYMIRGIFIINAPTIYMYNGKFRAFTIKDIKALLEDKYTAISFLFKHENTEEEILVDHPYFDNLNEHFKIQIIINKLFSLREKELIELKNEIEKSLILPI